MNLTDEYERATRVLNGINKAALDDALSMFKIMTANANNKRYLGNVRNLFNRMVSDLPLTAITTVDLSGPLTAADGSTYYRCERYPSLTATRANDKVEFSYSDTRRIEFYDQMLVNQEEKCYIIDILKSRDNAPSIVVKIVDDLFPIEMPYMPSDKYQVFGATHSFKMSSGEPDLVQIDFVKTPMGQLVKVDRYFRKITDGKYVDTDLENYNHYRSFGAVDLNYKWVQCLVDVDPNDSEHRHFKYFVAKDIEEKNGELVGTVLGRLSFIEPNMPLSVISGHMLESFEVFPDRCEAHKLYIRDIDKVVSNEEVLKTLTTGGVINKLAVANVKDVVIAMITSLNEYCDRQLKK